MKNLSNHSADAGGDAMTRSFQAGSVVRCVDRSANAKLTIGRTYTVLRTRADGSYPTIENDDGRPTQYSGAWFQDDASPNLTRRASDLLHIEAGLWVLMYEPHFMPDPDLARAVERLARGGSGWDCLGSGREQFLIVQVDRVMPKTFRSIDGKRHDRSLVVAAAGTQSELAALRDKLFAIGVEADEAIERETARVMAEFTRKTRADALAKVRRALPHIFGRVA